MPLSRLLARSASLSFLLTACVLSASAQTVTAPQLLPYTSKLVAGSGTKAIASGSTCPVSGFTATDAFGDGCLATEIQLVAPRDAISDAAGNVFFSDYTNGLVRRVDVTTGIVAAVAGGASASPAAGAACGTAVSLDARGDGCMATAVKLSKPAGLAFSPSGDLYVGDTGYAEVRKIAATAGLVPATGGIISLVAGSPATTYGYTANNASGTVNAATASFLDAPYGLAFDANGNLLIAEEFKEAVLAVNTSSTTTTETGVSIPAGTIAKLLGETSSGSSTCPNSPATTNGCNYGLATFGGQANNSEVDSTYAVAVDAVGNVYFAGEYDNFAGKISPTGVLTQFAGIQGAPAKKNVRGPAGSFGIGSPFGIAADANSNVYITDASSGFVWRVDGAGNSMYVVAGGGTPCSAAIDTYGDGCPATMATFGSSGTGNFATAASPGVYGVTVDAYSDLFLGDTVTNLIREVASGTQFGTIGQNQATTQTLDVHFAANDQPGAYSITSGASTFTLGTAACKTNSDATTDCLLPLTATPTALGAFTGTLKVTSTLGGTANFTLNGAAIMTPFTRISVTASSVGTSCTGSTVYATNAMVTLTATIASSGSPTGTVTFFSNGTQVGTPQTVNKGIATLTTTFTAANTYAITAKYSGDTYYQPSTTGSAASFTTSAPNLIASAGTAQQSTVSAGQTALYSFNLAQNVYSGTIAMTCSGLPTYASCSFSPATITATGCSGTSVIALSIFTQAAAVSSTGAGLGFGGTGSLKLLSLAAAFALALMIGLNRRRSTRFGQLWMAALLLIAVSGITACGNATLGGPATPSGTYNVTVTATGSTGLTSTFTVPLTVK